MLRKALKVTEFKEMKNKMFKVIRTTERLCVFCGKPIDRKEVA